MGARRDTEICLGALGALLAVWLPRGCPRLSGGSADASDDTVTSTVRRDYHWEEPGEFSHSMSARTSLTFHGDEIAVIEEFAAERVES